MLQIGRDVTDSQSGALHAKRPNLNAHAERFVRAIKDECLDRMIFVGQESLRRAVAEYMEHYHSERDHQGLESRLIVPRALAARDGEIIAMRDSAGH